MKLSKNVWIGVGVVAIIGAVWFASRPSSSTNATATIPADTPKTAIVYKSPTCGCCMAWISYLKKQGFEVTVENKQDMTPVKTEYGVPASMRSCHTAVIGDYVVEGHIPIEAITKLLTEKPAIDGIAMPGMPDGSPGMPGKKQEPFVISSLQDGQVTGEFMSL